MQQHDAHVWEYHKHEAMVSIQAAFGPCLDAMERQISECTKVFDRLSGAAKLTGRELAQSIKPLNIGPSHSEKRKGSGKRKMRHRDVEW